MFILSARETEMFADAIFIASEPGPILRAAARDYKRNLQNIRNFPATLFGRFGDPPCGRIRVTT